MSLANQDPEKFDNAKFESERMFTRKEVIELIDEQIKIGENLNKESLICGALKSVKKLLES